MQAGVRMWPILAACCGITACALFSGSKTTGEVSPKPKRRAVVVELPWDSTKVRDDAKAPIVSVVVLDDGADGVPVPYLYGYPLYADGEAKQGVFKLRADNRQGAAFSDRTDEHGVVHRTESLPQIGCTLEGFQEAEDRFAPVSLRCALPAPKAYGGRDRPVVGKLKVGARAADVVHEPSLEKAFLGEWHLVDGQPDKGAGSGYFNTDHGQLAFEFVKGRLGAVTYYFDPGVKGWRTPVLWMGP